MTCAGHECQPNMSQLHLSIVSTCADHVYVFRSRINRSQFRPRFLIKILSSLYSRGGQLFLSAGHIGLLFVSCGPNSSLIYIFNAQNGATAGRMLPPPAQQCSCYLLAGNTERTGNCRLQMSTC